MKIVVVGGTGRIGSRVVPRSVAQGHDAAPASPATGVDTMTGEGLSEVMLGADVVVDVSESRDWDDEAVTEFFGKSTRNQLSQSALSASVTISRCRSSAPTA
jgi:nucleoside-diphosphate-sugar epimerase